MKRCIIESGIVKASALFAIVVGASACEHSITEDIGNLRIAVTVSRPQFQTGDSTTVTTTVINSDSRSVMIEIPLCSPNFEVRRGPATILITPVQCDDRPTPSYLLAPSERREFIRVWHGEHPSLAVMLNTGSYALRGVVVTKKGVLVSDDTPIEILK